GSTPDGGHRHRARHEALRRRDRRERSEPGDRRPRVRDPARAERLRQDHALAADRRLHGARRRLDPCRPDRALDADRGPAAGAGRRGMGMVFQNYAVWPHKTVYQNVAFGLEVRKVGRAETQTRVARVLELVNLAGLERRYPSQLSGGQQQRVALARSLVVEPGILLLDEPLSNLDAKLRERMRWELKELQRRTGITFVYVTHDQSEAMALSDRIAVMHAGEIMQVGAPRAVYARPVNKIVADFMGLVNLISGRVVRPGAAGVVAVGGEHPIDAPVPPGVAPGETVQVAIRP